MRLPPPQTATVIGTVLDVTGATVPNALVALQGTDERRTFVTGDNGFFRFEDVKAGTPVRVEVSAAGSQELEFERDRSATRAVLHRD